MSLETDTDRLATDDFLVMFHGNYWPVSYRFPDKGRYLENFPTPVYLTLPLSGFPLRYCIVSGLTVGAVKK